MESAKSLNEDTEPPTEVVGKVHPTLGKLPYSLSNDLVFQLIMRFFLSGGSRSRISNNIPKHLHRFLAIVCHYLVQRRVRIIYRVGIAKIVRFTPLAKPIPEC